MWSYTWEVGRQLKKMSAEGIGVSFKYNHNGLRTQKVLEHDWYPETTNYTLHGKLLTHMTVDYTDLDEISQQDNLHFFYDSQSCPAKVSFNGTIYTYIHNLQSDIVGILDSNGTLVVEYQYDAWGKLLSTTGTLADTLGKRNPFRYRGYVYDEETRFYYIQSRFYDPEIDRFISQDEVFVNSILGNNLFCYCWNNSSNHADIAGTIAFLAILGKAAVGAIKGAASSIISDLIVYGKVDWKSTAKEAVKGAVGAFIPGRFLSGCVSVAVNTIEYLWECKTKGKEPSVEVITWEVASTIASETIGAGLEGGAKAANKMVDRVVREVAETGISTATSAVGKNIQKEAEDKRKDVKSTTATSPFSNSKMPYLKTIWDPTIGKYREITVYP